METGIYLIADRIRSLYNVGALFRTADAFGVAKIYLCGYTGAPPRREISKVALGADMNMPWEKRGQAWRVVEELQKRGVHVAALEINCRAGVYPPPRRDEPEDRRRGTRRTRAAAGYKSPPYGAGQAARAATPIHKFHPRFPIALVVGNEVSGVSPSVLHRADAIVHIPMLGQKESLNVSVAAGVALYALRYG